MDTYDDVEFTGPIVLSSDDLSPRDGRNYFLDDSDFKIDDKHGMHIPNFAVQEVAKCFFGREADWLRWRMRPDKAKQSRRCPDCAGEGKILGKNGSRTRKCPTCKGEGTVVPPQTYPDGCFILDGKPMEFKRKPSPTGSETARYFTLADIERMAHALAQQGIIDGTRLSLIVLQVQACARTWGVWRD